MHGRVTLPRQTGADGRVGFAGDTLNVAVYLKRSAPEIEVAYVTALGSDPLSARMFGFFAREGLDTGLVERRADRVPGLYGSALTSGASSFTYWRDSSAARTLFLPRPTDAGAARRTSTSSISGDHPRDPGARGAGGPSPPSSPATGGPGGRVAFDFNSPRLWPGCGRRPGARSTRSGSLTDVGAPVVGRRDPLTGDADAAAVLARLAAAGVRRGALKRGPEGPLPLGAGRCAPPLICLQGASSTPRLRATASTAATLRR